jgi:hypothetical protein
MENEITDAERRIDEALEESFPASDPPSFIGAGAKPGNPSPRKKARGDWGQSFGFSEFIYSIQRTTYGRE